MPCVLFPSMDFEKSDHTMYYAILKNFLLIAQFCSLFLDVLITVTRIYKRKTIIVMKEEQPSCDLHRAFQKTPWWTHKKWQLTCILLIPSRLKKLSETPTSSLFQVLGRREQLEILDMVKFLYWIKGDWFLKSPTLITCVRTLISVLTVMPMLLFLTLSS